jgi:hypothetical protein
MTVKRNDVAAYGTTSAVDHRQGQLIGQAAVNALAFTAANPWVREPQFEQSCPSLKSV